MTPLPIDAVLPDVLQAVARQGRVVLQAPPGTGKTTRVPPALARQISGRVVVLEPRRVAARAAARRVAAEWGCAVGAEVGFHVRGQRAMGDQTRVLFVTEGMFLRYAVGDPFLEGIGAVVLDEFHERSVDADLAIALARAIRSGLREDLAIVAMSATLDAAPVADYLDAPVVTATAPIHPLDVRYDPRPDRRPLEDRVAAAVDEVRAHGDVLVFLPGVGEIGRAARRIDGSEVLHGRLSAAEQDAVLRPGGGTSRGGTSRVILTTNVAESSLTVPGVRAVVDAGLVRMLRQDRQTGIDRLDVVPIARDAADQRAGRAGREGPGLVRRLWTARDHADRPAFGVPAIHRSDLAPVVLRLLAFGEPDVHAFPWFDPPRSEALDEALALLRALEAIDDQGLTPVGRRLAEQPLHPRLARFVQVAEEGGSGRWAARLALWLGDGGRPEGELSTVVPPAHRDEARLARTRGQDAGVLGRAARAGWPDRLARQRGTGAVMVGGTGVIGGRSPWFVALAFHPVHRGERGEWVVTLQAAVDPDTLPRTHERVTVFDGERVQTLDVERAGGLVLHRHPAPLDEVAGRTRLAEAASTDLSRVLPSDPAFDELRARLRFVASRQPHPQLPDGTDASLGPVLERLCHGRTTLAALRKASWRATLLDGLAWDARQHLDRVAPTEWTLPSGGRARLRYADHDEPVLAERIQRLFGLITTPVVGGQPILVHLLAPNGRPQQVTRDLPNFWASTYFEVRKELRRRYPKHAWPDDPTVPAPPRRRRR